MKKAIIAESNPFNLARTNFCNLQKILDFTSIKFCNFEPNLHLQAKKFLQEEKNPAFQLDNNNYIL